MNYLRECELLNRLSEAEDTGRRHSIMLEDLYGKVRRLEKKMSLDYDLFVINPKNANSTPEEIRDCVYDALERLDTKYKELSKEIKKIKGGM